MGTTPPGRGSPTFRACWGKSEELEWGSCSLLGWYVVLVVLKNQQEESWAGVDGSVVTSDTDLFFCPKPRDTRSGQQRQGHASAEVPEAVFVLLQERASRCAWGSMSP